MAARTPRSRSSSRPADDPSGLAAIALVTATLGVGLGVRAMNELCTLVSRGARYRIELGGVQRWWLAHRRHAA